MCRVPLDLLGGGSVSRQPSVASSWEAQGHDAPLDDGSEPVAPTAQQHVPAATASPLHPTPRSPQPDPQSLPGSVSVRRCSASTVQVGKLPTLSRRSNAPASQPARTSFKVQPRHQADGCKAAQRRGAAGPHISIDAIPACSRPSSGKLRRLRAAAINRKGPPRRSFDLRPLEPEPVDTVLDGFLMIEACDVDSPELAEVCVPHLAKPEALNTWAERLLVARTTYWTSSIPDSLFFYPGTAPGSAMRGIETLRSDRGRAACRRSA